MDANLLGSENEKGAVNSISIYSSNTNTTFNFFVALLIVAKKVRYRIGTSLKGGATCLLFSFEIF